jgi:molybdenum cofactor cytidylyltransferase
MPAAPWADPELVWPPRAVWRRVLHFHLLAAPLAGYLEVDRRHPRILARLRYNVGVVAAVILAAGESSRMGHDKGLLPVPGGGTFLSKLAGSLLEGGCAEVVAVVGAAEQAFRSAVERERLPVRLVRNPDPSRGQLSSLHEALEDLAPRTPRAIVVVPVDLPLVASSTVRAVIEAWARSGAPVVRPLRSGRHGHPVLFDARVLAELRAAELSAGARAVVRAHAAESLDVEVDDPGAFEDIDTPEDYRRVFGIGLSAP